MPDVHDPLTRSRNMAAIRSTNTKPELLLRRGLHRRGFRFRLNQKHLPGRPDIVLPKYNATIFMHGCFWHGHTCRLFRLPGTRTNFWESKIAANRRRDIKVLAQLEETGWRTAVIWECSLKGRSRVNKEELFDSLATWLQGAELSLEIAGQQCEASAQ